MKLHLERLQLDSDVTIGALTIDGEFECWTCEDTVRAPGVKLPGQTAIPVGLYPIEITYSPRFKRDMPLLVGVPNFSGVRIHAGNTAADTEGCILVGHDRYAKSVGHSRMAFEQLLSKLRVAAIRRDPIFLEVS
jgi:hypothetical protein